jgi:HSP20 family protein
MRQLTNYRGAGRDSLWDFMSEMERAFDDMWRSPDASAGTPGTMENFTPAVDLHETKDFYLVSADLPGVPEKNIKIDVQQGRLTITGERSREHKNDDGMFKRFEKSYGKFERSFQLPQGVNPDKIQARYENGVLEVLIPKAEVAKPKSIAINKEKGGLFSRILGQKDVEPATTPGATTEGPTVEKH